MSVKALVGACLVSMAMWLSIGTAVGASLSHMQEDDLMANCYFYGNGQCGDSAVWHGFINI